MQSLSDAEETTRKDYMSLDGGSPAKVPGDVKTMIAALNVVRKEMGKLKAAGISVGYFDELEHFVTNIAEKDEEFQDSYRDRSVHPEISLLNNQYNKQAMIAVIDRAIENAGAAPVDFEAITHSVVTAVEAEQAAAAALEKTPPDFTTATAKLNEGRKELDKARNQITIADDQDKLRPEDFGKLRKSGNAASSDDGVAAYHLEEASRGTKATQTYANLAYDELNAAITSKQALLHELEQAIRNPPAPKATTTTTTTPAAKPSPTPTGKGKGKKGPPKAFRGTPRSGVYLATGNGSHLKLTVDGRRVQITYATDFRYVCKGNQTKNLTGKTTKVYSFSFHPGWALHPVSSTGSFKLSLFQTNLEGQFTSPTTVRGSFQFDQGASSECHGNHTWTATLGGTPPAGIGPIVLPRAR